MGYLNRARDYLNFAAGTVTGRRDPLIPPPWLHSVGNSGFRETGEEYLVHFTELCGLKPNERVLDVGSGSGRMAIHLADYLVSGSYDDIEIIKRSVDWCGKAYSHLPNFRFHHADIYNGRYNRRGTKAADYRFPFPDESFDFVFLTSVFTHMLTQDVEHYISEIRRVLAPQGRALITAFLLNPETRKLIDAGEAEFSFRYAISGCFAETARQPERAIAYPESDLLEMFKHGGLEVTSVHHGNWRGRPGLSGQDIILARQGPTEP